MGYRIIRSDRRSLSIEINDDAELVVRAPRRMSEKEIQKFVCKHSEWADSRIERARERRRRFDYEDENSEELIMQAKEIIPVKVSYYGELMGIKPAGVKITSAKKRFGSCNAKNSLCFSWRLMIYPDEAIDYVVVHELAHIRHHNHSRAFYALVEKYMPDYRDRVKLLKK